ncbi:hypothetical protein [Saccharothrix sp. NRRL B-16314]|uniref:hypothetical protein n=1 Tax=Saccharothrix sp. NRRL B-16314 TaxID=1463825 RepID=UPI0005274E56|nr:hypothetical protein [Saccharothrix sp. NRRL B-16314]
MARKAMMPMMGGTGQGGRKAATSVVLVLLMVLVLRDPVGSAHVVQQLANWGGDVLDALGTFGTAVSK